MPTYEYRCSNCDHRFEESQSITAAPLVKCPVCHTPNLVRLISVGGGMIFKGSGYYITDYKKSGSGPSTPPATTKAPKKKPKEDSSPTTKSEQ